MCCLTDSHHFRKIRDLVRISKDSMPRNTPKRHVLLPNLPPTPILKLTLVVMVLRVLWCGYFHVVVCGCVVWRYGLVSMFVPDFRIIVCVYTDFRIIVCINYKTFLINHLAYTCCNPSPKQGMHSCTISCAGFPQQGCAP